MAQFMYLGGGLPGVAPGQTQPGLTTKVTQLRDPLDAKRAAAGTQGPGSDYPDGYLGTIQSRREDKLLDSLKTRLNQRSYQRGVHKGEQVDAADYFWPAEFNAQSGLQRQSAAVQVGNVIMTPRQVPVMTVAEEVMAYGDVMPARLRSGSAQPIPVNPDRRNQLARLMPDWR
jgi:hypothetical protein